MLTGRELNRALLARQLLLERSTLPCRGRSSGSAASRTSTRRTRTSGSGRCLEGFRREQLTRALERRTVVQGTLMRATIHLVSAREYWLYAAGHPARCSRVAAARRQGDGRARCSGGRRSAARRARRGRGPAKELGRVERHADCGWSSSARRRPGRGSGAAPTSTRSPSSGSGPCDASEDEGLDHLVRAYLRGFGPARLEDVSSWAGVPVRLLAPALDDCGCAASATSGAASCSISPARRCRRPRRPRRSASSRRGTPSCSSTPAARASCPRSTARSSSRRRTRRRCRRSSSTAASAGAWRYDDGRIELEPYERISRATRAASSATEGERLAASCSGGG